MSFLDGPESFVSGDAALACVVGGFHFQIAIQWDFDPLL